jgi:uncharacterized protein (TIRG00374 family)
MTEPTNKPLLSHKRRKAIILSLALTAIAYLGVVILTGYDKIQIAFHQVGLLGWTLLFTCSLLNYLIRFVRWQGYIKLTGVSIPAGRHFLYYLAGFALTTTPGKAGETIRSVLLRPHGVSYPASLASFFTERFLDVIIVAILASLSIFAFEEYTGFVLITTAIILLLLPLIRSHFLLSLLTSIKSKVNWAKLKTFLTHLISLIQSARIFLGWQRIAAGLGLGVAAWSIQGFAFYFIVSSLNVDLSLPAAMGIYSISLLAGAVSFIPGGVGSTEVVMGLLLAALGADTSVAVSAPLISRLSTLWFAVVLGLISSAWLSTHRY